MKPLFLIVLISLPLLAQGQQNRSLEISIGQPHQLTRHWQIQGWKNEIHLRAVYSMQRKKYRLGAGLNYSSAQVDWYAPFGTAQKAVRDFSVFIHAAYPLKINAFTILPRVALGAAFISTDIPTYDPEYKRGIYLSPDVTISYPIFRNVEIGLYSAFHQIFQKIKFTGDDGVQPDSGRTDQTIKYFSFGLTASYCFGEGKS